MHVAPVAHASLDREDPRQGRRARHEERSSRANEQSEHGTPRTAP